MRAPVQVAIADDHHLFRNGLALLLDQSVRVRVVGQASTTEEALRVVADRRPQALLLDVEMDHVPTELTVRRLRWTAPDLPVLILTMHEDAVLERQLRAAGAADYVTKDATATLLVERITAAVTRRPTSRTPATSGSAPEGRSSVLTDREQQVLRMIGQAQTNRAIGAALSIAEGTVKRHVVHIFAKLGATSRIDAVRKGQLLGEL